MPMWLEASSMLIQWVTTPSQTLRALLSLTQQALAALQIPACVHTVSVVPTTASGLSPRSGNLTFSLVMTSLPTLREHCSLHVLRGHSKQHTLRCNMSCDTIQFCLRFKFYNAVKLCWLLWHAHFLTLIYCGSWVRPLPRLPSKLPAPMDKTRPKINYLKNQAAI